jgi:hypothetical protein
MYNRLIIFGKSVVEIDPDANGRGGAFLGCSRTFCVDFLSNNEQNSLLRLNINFQTRRRARAFRTAMRDNFSLVWHVCRAPQSIFS